MISGRFTAVPRTAFVEVNRTDHSRFFISTSSLGDRGTRVEDEPPGIYCGDLGCQRYGFIVVQKIPSE